MKQLGVTKKASSHPNRFLSDIGNLTMHSIIDKIRVQQLTRLSYSATTSSPFVQSWLDEFASGFDKGFWKQHLETVN